MGLVGCPETSVRNYHFSLRSSPEERRLNLLRGGSLKSRKGYVGNYDGLMSLNLYKINPRRPCSAANWMHPVL
jgi:hypothetical protein